MNLNSKLLKVLILISFLFVTISMIVILSGFFDVSTPPDSSEDSHYYLPGFENDSGHSFDNISSEYGSADASGLPNETYSPECQPYPYIDVTFEYTIRSMSQADISRGSLILINHNNRFEPDDTIDLVYISDKRTSSFRVSRDNIRLSEIIIDSLVSMMEAFYTETGSNSVSVISGFRCLERQQEVLSDHIRRLGAAEARRWVSDPGHSEHHSGFAVDFGFYQNGVLSTFLGTGVTSWFNQHAYRFGFILRYPESKTSITQVAHEPWHFRYVGLPHAYFISHNGWALEEYIDFIKSHTRCEPFFETFRDFTYEIYFTQDLNIFAPYDSQFFDVSGTNTDGFIVTIRR
ncbi:MAG: M15 family metallopeptidase [Oscillospiraceae bacterium]|nr:M15 family metallopeptidase [Oscillospiraceae bacterium]